MLFRAFQPHHAPMARFMLRVTTASALAFVAIAATATLSFRRAQEAERQPACSTASSAVASARRRQRRAPSADRTAQMSDSDLVVRLDRLETQIRQLTGAIEQLQFRNQQLEGQCGACRRTPSTASRNWARRVRRARRRSRVRSIRRRSHRSSHDRRRPAGAAMRSIRRRIRTRPARRTRLGQRSRRSVAMPSSPTLHRCRGWRRRAARRAGRTRGGRAARSFDHGSAGRCAGPRFAIRAPAARWPRRCRPRRRPRDEYDLAYGYVLRKDYALAEESFRDFLQQVSERPAGAGGAILAGREPVPAPALSATPPKPSSTSRPNTRRPPRRRTRCCGSASRWRRWARRKRPAPRSARSGASIRAPRPSVKQGVEREQKRVRC